MKNRFDDLQIENTFRQFHSKTLYNNDGINDITNSRVSDNKFIGIRAGETTSSIGEITLTLIRLGF